jgi:hypothetical protein
VNLSIQRIFSKRVFDSFFFFIAYLFFSKCCLISFFFLFLLCCYFIHNNYYHFTKGKEPAQSPKPDSFEFDLFTVIISSRVTPAHFCWSLFLQVKAKQLLAQSFLTLFLLYKQRCNACALLGAIRCIRVWRLFTVIISSRMNPARFSRARLDAAV